MKIKNDYVLSDVVICALRYAIYRHTYIVSEIVQFIIDNPDLQNDRVTSVMLRDLVEVLQKDSDKVFCLHDCDRNEILRLRKWLEERLIK